MITNFFKRIFICLLVKPNRIGNNIELFLLSGGEEIDIDTYQDWNLCEYFLKRKHILFVVTGNNTVGLGHVYNTLLVANDILNHQITFLVDKGSGLALDLLKSKNYSVKIQRKEDIIEDIRMINPDVIVNDILDTSTYYIKSLKKLKYKVINFEDLGDGCKYADVVINGALTTANADLVVNLYSPNTVSVTLVPSGSFAGVMVGSIA